MKKITVAALVVGAGAILTTFILKNQASIREGKESLGKLLDDDIHDVDPDTEELKIVPLPGKNSRINTKQLARIADLLSTLFALTGTLLKRRR